MTKNHTMLSALLVPMVTIIPLSAVLFEVEFDYNLRMVLLGASILGLVTGVLGSFAVLRRQSLLGDTLSHAALPGVVIAFMLMGRELGWLLIGAGIAGWLGTVLMNMIIRTTRIKQDAALGIVLAVFFGTGMALLSYSQGHEDASRAGLDKFIFGQAAAIVERDVLMVSGVAMVVLLFIGLFWKEFKLLTFDSEFASTNGFPVWFLDLFLSTLIVVSIVLGLQLAGVILMVGMLIAPGVAARQWTNNLSSMVILSGLFGAAAGASGAVFSAAAEGLPTGPLIIVAASLIVIVSLLFAPERGLIWRWWNQRQDQQQFLSESLLADIYRLAEKHGSTTYLVPHGMLTHLHGRAARKVLRELAAHRLLEKQATGWRLTAQGVIQAEKVERNRQLWKLYRLYRDEFEAPPVVENFQQDIREVLPREVVTRLERLLA